MRFPARFFPLLLAPLLVAGEHESSHPGKHHAGQHPPEPAGTWFEGEDLLGNVTQLTFGGQNA